MTVRLIGRFVEPRCRLGAGLAAALVLTASGCGPPGSKEAFDAWVRDRVSVGDSAAEASDTLRRAGFSTHLVEPEPHEVDRRRAVHAVRRVPFLPLTERDWQVLLYLNDDPDRAEVVGIWTGTWVTGP